jgi:hypothetical protein
MVEALRYKPKGRGIESDDVTECFQFTYSFQLRHGPEVYSAPNKIEYHKIFLGVRRGRRVNLTISRQRGILEASQPYGLHDLLQG